MIELQGKSVLQDIAIGPLFFYENRSGEVVRRPVMDCEEEFQRYEKAVEEAGRQLEQLYERSCQTVGQANAEIFQVQKLLLLDEHTAALDPKTAAKVLEVTDKIVSRDNLTTIMITHNMKDAIAHGNRLVMMHEGHIIYDVAGEEKKNLTVADLLKKFEEASGGELANDRMMLN